LSYDGTLDKTFLSCSPVEGREYITSTYPWYFFLSEFFMASFNNLRVPSSVLSFNPT
jgi:hypothetical protein